MGLFWLVRWVQASGREYTRQGNSQEKRRFLAIPEALLQSILTDFSAPNFALFHSFCPHFVCWLFLLFWQEFRHLLCPFYNQCLSGKLQAFLLPWFAPENKARSRKGEHVSGTPRNQAQYILEQKLKFSRVLRTSGSNFAVKCKSRSQIFKAKQGWIAFSLLNFTQRFPRLILALPSLFKFLAVTIWINLLNWAILSCWWLLELFRLRTCNPQIV